jgi:hypothetical protein
VRTLDNLTKILLSITGIALAATLVVNANGTAKVIDSAGKAFSQSLTAAQRG